EIAQNIIILIPRFSKSAEFFFLHRPPIFLIPRNMLILLKQRVFQITQLAHLRIFILNERVDMLLQEKATALFTSKGVFNA
ncbi:MAG: hypothetical protein QXT54_01700, partial [Thermoplasmatales archaeon]